MKHCNMEKMGQAPGNEVSQALLGFFKHLCRQLKLGATRKLIQRERGASSAQKQEEKVP